MIYRKIKRLMDAVLSLLGLTILFPFIVLVAIAIKLDSKGPVIFKQSRLGLNGTIFTMYKFRSMHVDAEKGGVYEKKDDARVTRIGRLLRTISIDEIPQFFNIMKGEMSIIGPRPTLPYHPWTFDQYSLVQKNRFTVRPGITGWAQVNGRKDIEWSKRIEYDIEYVSKLSFLFDLNIFFRSIIKVLSMKDNLNVEETVKQNSKQSPLKLMYITNNEKIARIAEDCGVDWIFVDLEIIGKEVRQGHLDTVISHHKIEDVKKMKQVLGKAKLIVRVNPIHDGSEEEIKQVIDDGADIIMLPYYKSKEEVDTFIEYIGGRVKSCLLCETPEAVVNMDSILKTQGIDYMYIGINDLHLGYKMKFMFKLLADGTVDMLCNKFKERGIPYGFGGIARLGHGVLPAEYVIAEFYRLGSSMVILSRSFCNANGIEDYSEIEKVFRSGISEIRAYEERLLLEKVPFFIDNHNAVIESVAKIERNMED